VQKSRKEDPNPCIDPTDFFFLPAFYLFLQFFLKNPRISTNIPSNHPKPVPKEPLKKSANPVLIDANPKNTHSPHNPRRPEHAREHVRLAAAQRAATTTSKSPSYLGQYTFKSPQTTTKRTAEKNCEPHIK
jgi:hypothetical protein